MKENTSLLNEDVKRYERDLVQLDEDGITKNLVNCKYSFREPQRQLDATERKAINADLLCRSTANDIEIEENSELGPTASVKSCKNLTWVEPFAEVWLGDGWVPVEVIPRKGFSENNYLVRRIDIFSAPFEVKLEELTLFGSHEPESSLEI